MRQQNLVLLHYGLVLRLYALHKQFRSHRWPFLPDNVVEKHRKLYSNSAYLSITFLLCQRTIHFYHNKDSNPK